MNRNRRQRSRIDLPNPPQRFRQNPLLRLQLFVEPQFRPVTATALRRYRTRNGSTIRTGLDEAHQISMSKTLLHLTQTHNGNIAGIDIRDEDREPVDLRQRRPSGNELEWRNCDLVTDLHRGRG